MGTGSWGCSWLSRSIARPELPAVTGRLPVAVIHHPGQRRGREPRRLPTFEVRKRSEPGGNRRDRQRTAIGAPWRIKGDIHMAAELLGPLRQVAVEPIAQAHPRAGINAQVPLAIDQDRRDPLHQKLLGDVQGDRRLAAARNSDERCMLRQFSVRHRDVLGKATGGLAHNDRNRRPRGRQSDRTRNDGLNVRSRRPVMIRRLTVGLRVHLACADRQATIRASGGPDRGFPAASSGW